MAKSYFDDVGLTWKGREYVIRGERMMGAIMRVEDSLTGHEIAVALTQRGTVNLSRVASAYAGLLSYAGAEVQPEEVYQTFFKGGDDSQAAEGIMDKLRVLLAVMTPTVAEGAEANGNG